MVCTKPNGTEFLSVEKYFVVYLDDNNGFSYDNWTQAEKNLTKNSRWWSCDEIENSTDEFFADNLSEILKDIIDKNLPDIPLEI